MLWNAKDITLYLQEKQYVDTAVIPLLPIGLNEDLKDCATQVEFISLLTMLLEKQFKGRMMLFPSLTYLKNQEEGDKILEAKKWASMCKDAGFTHVFFLTSDSFWKMYEEDLEGQVIWVPSIPLEHMDESYKYSLMEDQVKQFVNIIVHKWQSSM
ncbi:hypothetical protein J2S13_000079 [Oikeobacillus pervagus]|uniref:DUF2487 family protein n=1 Tax=Oikeobacillus pervagus TaxID=1325931 RepID=A0AAJ1SVL9_9BACI|nr:YpiF family protein [Oikeobacillus pervagus]MDQ0213685.1 hypothetical protein [Oikeobacillus pervagus]